MLQAVKTFSSGDAPLVPYESARFMYEEKIERIQSMIPRYNEIEIKHLKINRVGSVDDSGMIALGLHKGVRLHQTYRVTLNGLIETDERREVRHLEKDRNESQRLPERYTEVKAIWDKTPFDIAGSDNILGYSGSFKVDSNDLTVPVIEAEESALSYYGATLINLNELVEFDDDQYPIWAMSLGTNYVQGCLMQERGFYLEYHHDKPHFHMPLSEEAGGCYLLAKRVGEVDSLSAKHLYHITGFKIPYGKAVYTYKSTIHCDAALTGKLWMVGYTNAEDFSTVLVHTRDDQKASISFESFCSDT